MTGPQRFEKNNRRLFPPLWFIHFRKRTKPLLLDGKRVSSWRGMDEIIFDRSYLCIKCTFVVLYLGITMCASIFIFLETSKCVSLCRLYFMYSWTDEKYEEFLWDQRNGLKFNVIYFERKYCLWTWKFCVNEMYRESKFLPNRCYCIIFAFCECLINTYYRRREISFIDSIINLLRVFSNKYYIFHNIFLKLRTLYLT